MNRRTRISQQGFTLLELSIVLLIMSVMAAGLMTVMAQNARNERIDELNKKMDAIENALIAFRRANNRLPCPADGTTLITAANFGVEAVNPGSCTTGATFNSYGARTAAGTISANFYYLSGSVATVGGVVPTK